MVLINTIFEKKIVAYPSIFLIFISCIGLFNSSWYSLVIYQILFLLFFSAKINFNKKYWLIVALLVPIIVFTKQNLELPKIVQGSNVFIGGEDYNNSVFNEKLPKKIYNKLKQLLLVRRDQTAFHPNALQFTLHLGNDLYGVWRQSIDKKQSIFCITNVTEKIAKLSLLDINLDDSLRWHDLITEDVLEDNISTIELKPYQTVWLSNK